MDKQMKTIIADIDYLETVYRKLLTILPSFDITDKKILPYGLKPHTRSISWLVEQVITQQTKFNKKKLGLDEVIFDLPDTCLHDCEIKVGSKVYYVNVKIHDMGKKENKNDIAAVEKLYMQYSANPHYNLLYVCFGVLFDNITIKFHPKYLSIFSPQFLPIYINPRNDKIQAAYYHKQEMRTREDFLKLLRKSSKSIVL
ncbi:MAG: hypothetical protein AAB731_00930 [Patescibacteria group bacterium]